MFCTMCGAKAIEGAEFCQKCGYKLRKVNETAKAPHGSPEPVSSAGNKTLNNASEKKKAWKLPAILGVVVLAAAFVVFVLFRIEENRQYADRNEKYTTDEQCENVNLSETYENEDEGFSFMYPEGWEIENVEEIDPDALVSVGRTGALGTYARIMVNKDINDGSLFAATKTDFEEIYSSIEGLSDLKVMDLSDIRLDGHPARKLTVSANFDTDLRNTVTEYFYLQDSYIYCVSCFVEETNYDRYKPIFNAIMDSYTIYSENTPGFFSFTPGSGAARDSDNEDPFGYEGDEDYTSDLGYGLFWVEMPYITTDEFGFKRINGVIENRSGYTKDWITVYFDLYDANEYYIDSASDSIQNLKNGNKWKFSTTILDSDAAYWEFSYVSVY